MVRRAPFICYLICECCVFKLLIMSGLCFVLFTVYTASQFSVTCHHLLDDANK